MPMATSSQGCLQECVILLHGLIRSDASMAQLASSLEDCGYLTVNYHYPSSKYPIEKLANDAITEALLSCPASAKINFVTHSMGGILVRQYLSRRPIANLGRVVMLGPPNKGTEVVDKLQKIPGFKLIHGPAGMQCGTGRFSVPNKLGPANFELGVIAGTSSINLILSTLITSPDDGKISVENTKLEGMTDHITMPVTHPFMMKNKQVIEQVKHFLKHGAFKK